MKYQVRITIKADADIDSVLEWFQEHSSMVVGTRWLSQLWSKITTLEQHPERCPLAVEADKLGIEIRELLFGKRQGVYRLLFQIQGRTVHILRVWHSARDAVSGEDL